MWYRCPGLSTDSEAEGTIQDLRRALVGLQKMVHVSGLISWCNVSGIAVSKKWGLADFLNGRKLCNFYEPIYIFFPLPFTIRIEVWQSLCQKSSSLWDTYSIFRIIQSFWSHRHVPFLTPAKLPCSSPSKFFCSHVCWKGIFPHVVIFLLFIVLLKVVSFKQLDVNYVEIHSMAAWVCAWVWLLLLSLTLRQWRAICLSWKPPFKYSWRYIATRGVVSDKVSGVDRLEFFKVGMLREFWL